MTDMLCSKCEKHYVGKGWFCWSGNKSLYLCNNGNPGKDRKLYNSRKNEGCTERQLVKKGVIPNDR